MRKNDFILIIVLLVLSLIPMMIQIGGTEIYKKSAIIWQNGEIIRQVDLSKDIIFDIKIDGGHNVIKVEAGFISIIDADCADKTCIKIGKIQKVGDIISCVPHKLMIEVK